MQDFVQWLENRSNTHIRVLNIANHKIGPGEIRFLVNGNTYTYAIDSGYFFNGPLKRLIKHRPGEALNMVKQVGELTHKNDVPIPVTQTPNVIQKTLF